MIKIAGFLILLAAVHPSGYAQPVDGAITSHTAIVSGVQLHYLIAGRGPTVILLHGFAETSLMWKPLMPLLAERFTVIAPDLPGIGDSGIPKDAIGMKGAAETIHQLAKSLGTEKVRVVGHDIGLMVAYAYASMFPGGVEKLVVMDAFLPGVGDWKSVYDNPRYWHFRFNGATPEQLVRGREPIYFAYFWNDLAADKNHSIPQPDREAYLAAYSRPGRMRAAWAYFVSFQEAAVDFAGFARHKLSIPVLSIGGEKSLGGFLGQQMKLAASDVSVIVLPETGHWIMEERPRETKDALIRFLNGL
jgi:pimeloyl-ACP methyl ester carboxylesterase